MQDIENQADEYERRRQELERDQINDDEVTYRMPLPEPQKKSGGAPINYR